MLGEQNQDVLVKMWWHLAWIPSCVISSFCCLSMSDPRRFKGRVYLEVWYWAWLKPVDFFFSFSTRRWNTMFTGSWLLVLHARFLQLQTLGYQILSTCLHHNNITNSYEFASAMQPHGWRVTRRFIDHSVRFFREWWLARDKDGIVVTFSTVPRGRVPWHCWNWWLFFFFNKQLEVLNLVNCYVK